MCRCSGRVSCLKDHLTHLKEIGFFISYEENNKLIFIHEEEFDDWKEVATPQEQFNAIVRTESAQKRVLEKWESQLEFLKKHDQGDISFLLEAKANVAFFKIKLNKTLDKLFEINLDEIDTGGPVKHINSENPYNNRG